jgi:hypothetical protein
MAKSANNQNNQQEFSKVYKAALESTFRGTISVENLLKVIYATSNPEVAMELVLDIYNEPVIEQCVVHDTNGKKLTFISFNAFGREVNYSYEQNKTVHIYVSKDVDVSEITSENYQDYKKSWNDDTKSHNVILPQMETLYSSIDLLSWNKLQVWKAPRPADIDYCIED